MTAISEALTAALLHFTWQGLLVAFLLWAALTAMGKRSANARYAVCCAAMVVLVVLPVITASMALTRGSGRLTLVARPVPATAAAPQSTAVRPGVTAAGAAAASVAAALEPWALPVWSLGVLVFALRAVWGCRRVAAMRRWGRPAETGILEMVSNLSARLGLTRPVRVLATAWAEGPSVAGWIRPVILLPPATALGLTPEQLEAVLAHELAHIRRYDHLVNAAQILVETLLFYHPAVWWVSGRMRHERELCCDDLAVRSCGDALCYARALTKLERLRVAAPAMAVGSTDGSLFYRIQRLMGAGNREVSPSKLPGLVALALGLAGLALNVHMARGQAQEAREQPRVVSQRSEAGGLITDEVIAVPVEEAVNDAPGVTVDLRGANLLHRSSLEYPEAAMKSGVQGTVVVEATLDGGGNVNDARVLSGPMELRRSVITSVFQWHFAGATAGSTRTVNVTFQTPPAGSEKTEGSVFLMSTPEGPKSVIYRNAVGDLNRELEAKLQDSIQVAVAVNAWEQASDSDRKAAEQQVRELRAKIEDIQRTRGGQPDGQKRIAETEQALRELVAKNRYRPVGDGDGRPVGKIEINGLSDQARKELEASLPVHVGDILEPGSRDRIQAAVRKFDEHLNVFFNVPEGSDAARIRIEPSGGWKRE